MNGNNNLLRKTTNTKIKKERKNKTKGIMYKSIVLHSNQYITTPTQGQTLSTRFLVNARHRIGEPILVMERDIDACCQLLNYIENELKLPRIRLLVRHQSNYI